jgi:pimeloyl-ACP methyl ester carboxylesterase
MRPWHVVRSHTGATPSVGYLLEVDGYVRRVDSAARRFFCEMMSAARAHVSLGGPMSQDPARDEAAAWLANREARRVVTLAGAPRGGPSIGWVTLASGEFGYEATGPVAGELVLCAHGFPDHPRSYRPLARALAARGFRVVAPWMRGYHPSTRVGPYHAARIAADLVELAEALSPSRKAVLVGHDWGACGAYCALSRPRGPFRKAVTIAVPHPRAFARNAWRHPAQLRQSSYMAYLNVPWVSDAGIARDDFAFVDRLWRAWSPGLVVDPVSMRELKDCFARSLPAPLLYYRALRDVDWIRTYASLGRVKVPTLYVHGAEDGCISAAMAEGQERDFSAPLETLLVAGAGHFVHLEAPDVVAEAVLRWIT